MRKAMFFILLLPFCSVDAQELKGDYLGQTPPGAQAKLFHGGGLVKHENKEKRSFNLAFSPDGKELFFSYYKATKEIPHPTYEIKTFKQVNGQWTGPETAPFSGKFSDVDINYSPDGNFIFFASDRPQPRSSGLDIYYAVKTGNGWSQPIYAGTEVNTPYGEVYPSVSTKRNLFFRSSRPGGFGEDDLYRAAWVNGNFIEVKNLGPNVNTKYGESNAVIAADERYILFCSARSADGVEQIYVSFQTGDNVWTQAVALGPEVNTKAGAGAPTLSSDGKYLFFKKRAEPVRGIYWISTEIIEAVRPKEIKR
ncbi:TolB family protein [Spongiimicrobium sp. 2-473A-2-J]|uniref:TolB family protein n=1 Tax=Eudoraea algarum TaxID=3417568 RepID=UPI003D369C7C